MQNLKQIKFAPRRPVILAVFAHPDDESFLAGGTLAYYARRGIEVKLLCLTHGEQGYSDTATAYERRILPYVRQAELAWCCETLGVQLLPLLDFPDGKLAEFKPAVLARRIAQAIRQHRPEIVLTFGAEGLTRHPDHLAIYRATTLAFQAAANPGMALFYAGLSEIEVTKLSTRLEGSLGGIPLLLTGAPGIELDTAIDIQTLDGVKWAALACHRTQAAGFTALKEKDFQLLGRKEYFQLKMVGGAYGSMLPVSGYPGSPALDLFDRVSRAYQPLPLEMAV
jgi:LmbE family N-acetylglucosaminyl deacetylase